MNGTVHLVAPYRVDDPARPSGGNTYDLRLRDELPELGWDVHLVRTDGPLPTALEEVPDGGVVLVDGLLASPAGDDIATVAARLRVVVLLHMPLAEADPAATGSERRALEAACAVVTVSQWSRSWVVAHHRIPPDRVVVAEPGTDRGPLMTAGPEGGRLLCVGPVVPEKGQALLIEALARLRPGDVPWTLTCAGSLALDPDHVSSIRAAVDRAGLADRVVLTGPLTPAALDRLRSGTDLLVSASRRESYGMALTEALARGVPVLATDVGGVREAIGEGPDGTVPGLLASRDDPDALAAQLDRWLTDAALRARLRAAAAERRERLVRWRDTASRVAAVLGRVREGPG